MNELEIYYDFRTNQVHFFDLVETFDSPGRRYYPRGHSNGMLFGRKWVQSAPDLMMSASGVKDIDPLIINHVPWIKRLRNVIKRSGCLMKYPKWVNLANGSSNSTKFVDSYKQDISIGPSIDRYPSGETKLYVSRENGFQTILKDIPSEWVTSEIRWKNSEYEYLGREFTE